ncbi:MAG: nucleotide exchange factor GrpE [Geminicoccales bacterium]
MNQTKHNQPTGWNEPEGEPVEDRAGLEPTATGGAEPRQHAEAPGQAEPAEAQEPAARVAELEAELGATKDRLLRALADLENLRRRTERELDEARKYAITGFARELLEVADNLSRALQTIPDSARGDIGFVRNLAEGIEMTEKALMASFERHQIARVEPAPGDRFDHNRHQAMYEVETDQHAPGSIAQVLQPGYTIADRLLRPAMVGIAKSPSAGAGGSGDGEAGAAEDSGARPGRRLDTTA